MSNSSLISFGTRLLFTGLFIDSVSWSISAFLLVKYKAKDLYPIPQSRVNPTACKLVIPCMLTYSKALGFIMFLNSIDKKHTCVVSIPPVKKCLLNPTASWMVFLPAALIASNCFSDSCCSIVGTSLTAIFSSIWVPAEWSANIRLDSNILSLSPLPASLSVRAFLSLRVLLVSALVSILLLP